MRFFSDLEQLAEFNGVVLDCRFSLTDSTAGRQAYEAGHIPGALYLDLEQDMSAPVQKHGGRHPLPAPTVFAQRLAALGLSTDTQVLLYDDSRYAFAARCWWMLRALGFHSVRLLQGGYSAWIASGGAAEKMTCALPATNPPAVPSRWPGYCDRDEMIERQAGGARLVDAREGKRYRGEHEPIDPVAGHIPGAENMPWQDCSSEEGFFLDEATLRERWSAFSAEEDLVMYCGSGVSACVNILALAELGRENVWLYGGSWSDWCSYL